MYFCICYGVFVYYIYIYVKLLSFLFKDILYIINSIVYCMMYVLFVIVCIFLYIWIIKNKDKVLFFFNLIYWFLD